MNNEIKSGKEVIEEFFAGILNVEGVDPKTVEKLLQLYREDKLTDVNIQNELEELKQEEINSIKEKDNAED